MTVDGLAMVIGALKSDFHQPGFCIKDFHRVLLECDEMQAVVEVFDLLAAATDHFADTQHCDPIAIADTISNSIETTFGTSVKLRVRGPRSAHMQRLLEF